VGFGDQAEFMEHDEKPLPIDIRTLGQLAEKVSLLISYVCVRCLVVILPNIPFPSNCMK
jgi:hypothetical protein